METEQMLHFARWFEAMDIIKRDVEKGNYFNETINMRIVNQCEYFIEKNRMDKEYFIDLHYIHDEVNHIYELFDEGIQTKDEANRRMLGICEGYIEQNRIERREKKR